MRVERERERERERGSEIEFEEANLRFRNLL